MEDVLKELGRLRIKYGIKIIVAESPYQITTPINPSIFIDHVNLIKI